jgi:hypothetical protein
VNKLFHLIAKILEADPIDIGIWAFNVFAAIAVIALIVGMVSQIRG